MSNQLSAAFTKKGDVIDWAELVLFLSDRSHLDIKKVKEWSCIFFGITVAGQGSRPTELPEEVSWYSYENGAYRSEVWNVLLGRVEKEWVLYLEDDEQILFSDFPEERALRKDLWCPALIRQDRSESIMQLYQMRLVYTEVQGERLFRGLNLPDCTQFITANGIELYNRPFVIERKTSPIDHINVNEELSVQTFSPKLYLVQGDRYYRQGKYVRAAAQYRQLLKKKKLLPFDRLAAINGLASCMAEQYKWSNAMMLAEESLQAESLQALPYLIQFKINELQKNWKQAYTILLQYYERRSLFSRASFDKIMDEETTLVNLADIALKAGERKQASDYFDELFTHKRWNVDRDMLYKVLVLSIELSDYERAVHLFNRMYKDLLSEKLDDEQQKKELNNIMSMFIKKGWHGFVANVYSKLYQAYPRDETYKRRLIVALTKTNRLDKARSMLSNII